MELDLRSTKVCECYMLYCTCLSGIFDAPQCKLNLNALFDYMYWTIQHTEWGCGYTRAKSIHGQSMDWASGVYGILTAGHYEVDIIYSSQMVTSNGMAKPGILGISAAATVKDGSIISLHPFAYAAADLMMFGGLTYPPNAVLEFDFGAYQGFNSLITECPRRVRIRDDILAPKTYVIPEILNTGLL
jgi:hypothetical protein